MHKSKRSKQTRLFAGDILQIFLRHDFPQAGFYLALGPLSLCRSAETSRHKNTEGKKFYICKCLMILLNQSSLMIFTRQRRAQVSRLGATAHPAWRSTR